jgi:CHAD domain-containing protein
VAVAKPPIDLFATVTGATAREAITLAVRSTVERLVEQQALVQLATNSEAAHQARVATRRLRSDLRTFSVLFEPGAIGQLRDELGWLAGLLGQVRDADILMARLQPSLGSDEATAEQREILGRLNRQQAKARMELLTAMAEPRYSALLDSLARLAAAPPLSEVAEAPADEFMAMIVGRTWRKLRSAVLKLDKHPDDARLHAVRIEAKRCRYAVEAAAPAVGKAAVRFAEAVADLQQALGDYNDAVISAGWLTQASGQMDASTAFLAGVLHEAQNGLARKAKRKWPAAWRRLDRKKIHSWLDVA